MRLWWRWLRAGLTIPVLLASTGLQARAVPVSFVLDNGLRVVVQEDRRAPVVVTQVWYRVGSSDEPPGLTGISHVLEHMMFKGSPRVPAGELSRLVAHFGGDDNAFTSDNYTVYYQNHVADRLGLALELEADRMSGLRLAPEEFASELQVVMEERRLRTDDNPQALALERFRAMAWPSSPARSPTVGWMRDLQALTVEDARAWYERWYAPNNAVLVVVGDVSPQQVRELAEHYFGALPARPLPRRAEIAELPEPGERTLDLTLPGQVPTLFLGYNLPSLTSADGAADAYALRVLAGVLDEGISARLERRLVRAGKATAIRSSYDLLARGDTLLSLMAVPARGQSLEALRQAVLDEIRALRDAPVAPEEIQRVLANVVSQEVFARDQVEDQARVLGRLVCNDMPLSWLTDYPAQLRAVTPAQLQEVAQRYLVPARLSTLYLRTEAPEPPLRPMPGGRP